MTTVALDPTAKRPGPGLAISIVAIVLGTVVGVTGLVIGVVKVAHNLGGFVATSPARFEEHLTTGTWQVYVDDDRSGLGTITPQEVHVTASDGTSVPTTTLPGSLSESETRGGISYQAEVRFNIATEGDYQIQIDGPTGAPVLVAKSFGDLAKHAAGWFVMMGFGMLIGLVGVIMLIVGIVRRRRFTRGPIAAFGGFSGGAFPPGATQWQPQQYQAGPTQGQPAAAGGLPVAGWYADPSVPGMQRWWDGTRWTDQTQSTT